MLQEYWASTVIFIAIFSQCTRYSWKKGFAVYLVRSERSCVLKPGETVTGDRYRQHLIKLNQVLKRKLVVFAPTQTKHGTRNSGPREKKSLKKLSPGKWLPRKVVPGK